MRIFSIPAILLRLFAVGFMVIPMILTLMQSFDPRNFLSYNLEPQLNFKWYQMFFNTPLFANGLSTSLELSALVMLVALSVGIPSAVALSRVTFRGRGVIQTILLSPLIVPGVVLGVGLLEFFGSIGSQVAFINLMIAQVIVTFPYVLRTVTASCVGFDRSLEEASLTLGANDFKTFRSITFPLIRPGVIAGGLFSFTLSFSDVATSIFLIDPNTITLPSAILIYLRNYVDSTAAAASIIMIGINLVLLLVIDRVFGIDKFLGAKLF